MAVKSNQKMGETSSRLKECFTESHGNQTETIGEAHSSLAVDSERDEIWGKLSYNTLNHRFSFHKTDEQNFVPYSKVPVVLNIDLTMNCNMDCMHCVTKDFGQEIDLVVSKKLVDWINKSPFLVIVITGGEPLLANYEDRLLKLLEEIHNKGLIIDTNGTIFPSNSVIDAIKRANALVRVSWDSARPQDEIYFRHMKPDTTPNRKKMNLDYYYQKTDTIKRLRSAGVNVAIQSVVHIKNHDKITDLIPKLQELSIKQWYIQRFISSHKAKSCNLQINYDQYEQTISKLVKKCRETEIKCITKKDRRHNCVILLVGEGILYTQGEEPGQKIRIGKIGSEIEYFEYVSSADHADRYYG